MFHLPRFCSDHLPIVVRPSPIKKEKGAPFRCENWWLLKPDFKTVCQKAVEGGEINWESMNSNFKAEVKRWVQENKAPEQMLKEIEEKMGALLKSNPNQILRDEEIRLNQEHDRYLLMWELLWHQSSRVKWAEFGDRNSVFFHASTITRRRRNNIGSLFIQGIGWITEEGEICRAFVNHFKAIYKKGARPKITETYSPQFL